MVMIFGRFRGVKKRFRILEKKTLHTDMSLDTRLCISGRISSHVKQCHESVDVGISTCPYGMGHTIVCPVLKKQIYVARVFAMWIE